MPPWGRPPGGRPGRKNERPWESQRSWEYDDRVEELDTDDDVSQGVELNQAYGRRRFVSDELRLTGMNLGGGGVRQRRSADVYDDDFTPSDDEDDFDAPSGLIRRPDVQMQLTFREKEEMLVERALERIARARALGKPNVKLTRAEIDALKRLERNQNPPRPSEAPNAAPKSKKEAPVRRKAVEVRRKPVRSENNKSASNSPKGKEVNGRSRGRSSASNDPVRESRDDSVTPYPPSPVDPDYGRRLPYPQGYYVSGPRQAESSRQGSRANSNPPLRQQPVQPYPPYQHPYYTNRYSSNPGVLYSARPGSNTARTSRPDPSDPDWEPRARSTSSLVNVPLDQLPYQTSTGRAPRFDPSDPRFASPPRRVASGPVAALQHQVAQYRRPQDETFLPDEQPEVMRYLAPPDSEEGEEEEEEEDDDEEDSDYDEGVQVDVNERPDGEYTIQTRSVTASTSTSTHKVGRNTGKGTAGKGKKAR
ncbi:uncharacterized protein Z518_10356 [Rhinocladiella mackenziei CBS 650.93]|uniref:Rhinocladiella mackenziei CBS 650.93 unplaced genomic scaffold supercont1.9, whole genome shotgun sequence n=1 Tax=Rhinocladiella mackenziei CBS 650.93 TaxID=1442369 RepID=A0A0D2FDQ5_9EURO|nr:uncharacterized protein Z518_10356 [Rhinocladiella mackenziei CBS 650.93]KIX00217.1 hypothetical protein Z518_10356 [Rhinocladiella mackenziei CBS 650.93]